MNDLAGRLAHRIQLTTDGHRAYVEAVENSFGGGIDYSMLVKMYGNGPGPGSKYSPGECIGCQTVAIVGQPKPWYVSTSHVERQNLTMRVQMRRFARMGERRRARHHRNPPQPADAAANAPQVIATRIPDGRSLAFKPSDGSAPRNGVCSAPRLSDSTCSSDQ
jgi:hypothetical protein